MTYKLTLSLVLLLACFLSPIPTFGQQGNSERISLSAGYSVPLSGYYWRSGSSHWSNYAHLQGLYERALTSRLNLGAVIAYDEQRSGNLGFRAYSGGIRASYATLQKNGFAFAPYLEIGAASLSYISYVEHVRGSSRIAPRMAFGASFRQHVWRGASLTAALDYQIILDRFDGFEFVDTSISPRGPHDVAPPSFRYAATRLGLSWSF